MGYYIIVALVLAFIVFIIGVAIKWEIDFSRWKSPVRRRDKIHTKETTATSSTDVATPVVGFTDIATYDAMTRSNITSDTNDPGSRNDLNSFDTSNFDENNSDNTANDSGYSGSFDSGGSDGGGDSGGD